LRVLDRTRDALDVTSAAVAATSNSAARRVLMLQQYELAWECDDAPVAIRSARAMFGQYRSSSESATAAADLVNRNATQAISTSALLEAAEVLSAQGDTDDLKRALRSLDTRTLGENDAEEHRLLWAEYHYQTGDYSRAIALARPSYSSPPLRRRSMLVMARSLRKLGKPSEAAAMYQQFVVSYPNDPLAAEALYASASLYARDGRGAESARVLDQLRRSYPSTFHGWAAAMRRAGTLSDEGAGEEAAAIYQQWLARSQRTDEAALFYLAQENERSRPGSGQMILEE
jgi:tetratricopeptide (TPR) repeat protein